MRRECELLRDTPYIRREIPKSPCYKFRGCTGKQSSLEIVFPRTWQTGRTTVRVRHEEAEWRSVRSPGSGVSPWPTCTDTVNGTEVNRARVLVVNLACQVEYDEKSGSRGDDRRCRREFSWSHRNNDILTERTGRFYDRRRSRTLGLLTRRGASSVALSLI